jgi:hypothetical protein
MPVVVGWSPLPGPKVHAELACPGRVTSPVSGILLSSPIPSTMHDGFIEEAGALLHL